MGRGLRVRHDGLAGPEDAEEADVHDVELLQLRELVEEDLVVCVCMWW